SGGVITPGLATSAPQRSRAVLGTGAWIAGSRAPPRVAGDPARTPLVQAVHPLPDSPARAAAPCPPGHHRATRSAC
ncbi:MAG: hypothetical protein ACRDTX_27625, partial [Pseudonocardiaceae bacterium]